MRLQTTVDWAEVFPPNNTNGTGSNKHVIRTNGYIFTPCKTVYRLQQTCKNLKVKKRTNFISLSTAFGFGQVILQALKRIIVGNENQKQHFYLSFPVHSTVQTNGIEQSTCLEHDLYTTAIRVPGCSCGQGEKNDKFEYHTHQLG